MKRSNNRRKTVVFLTRGAVIAALYAVLTYLVLPIAGGVIQFRISEMLCILPLFFPEAIPGLFVGCIIANILIGAIPVDIIFGSVATLIGAVGAFLCRKLPHKLKWMATLPTIIANTLIIPPILVYAYGSDESLPFVMLTVFIGELLSAGICGSVLYYSISKTKLF